jgi:diketogulonate reductase-like aldo/keto reductase
MRSPWYVVYTVSTARCVDNPNPQRPQVAYGLGTANFKRGGDTKIDKKIIEDTVTAIKAGFNHLDGAEGMYSVSRCRADS